MNVAFGGLIAHVLFLGAGLAWLAQGGAFVLQAANALFLALVIVQLGFYGHDAMHRQIVKSRTGSFVLGFFLWNLCCGISLRWWHARHSQHHRHPHEEGMDPDLYGIFAFSPQDLLRRSPPARWVAQHQAFLFPLIVAFTALYFQLMSLVFLAQHRPRLWLAEVATLAVRHGLFLGLVFTALAPPEALAFLAIHYVATGWYLGAIFACNHYGLPVVAGGRAPPEPERTFAVTRNVRTGRLGDYLFGGLNYQIEHHLQPHLPRSGLRRAAQALRAERRVSGGLYHETGWSNALCAVFRQLHTVGVDARRVDHVAT